MLPTSACNAVLDPATCRHLAAAAAGKATMAGPNWQRKAIKRLQLCNASHAAPRAGNMPRLWWLKASQAAALPLAAAPTLQQNKSREHCDHQPAAA